MIFLRVLCAFVVFSFLAACADLQVTGNGGADPLAAIAGADATQDAAKIQLTMTAQYIAGQKATATLQAARTAGAAQIEINRLQAQMQAAQQQFDLQLAAGKATEEAARAQETRQAAITAQAAQHARLTQIAAPTATAWAMAVNHEHDLMVQRQWQDYFWLWFWPVFFVVLLVGLVALVVKLWLDLKPWLIRWWNLRLSIRGPEGGRWAAQAETETPAYVPSVRPLPLARPDPVRALGRTDAVLVAPMQPRAPLPPGARTASHLVAQLLEDSIAVAGEGSRILPGWRSLQERGLDWDSARWQRAVTPLVQAGAVVPELRVATHVAPDYYDLGGLLDAVETRRLRVAPAPLDQTVGEG